jgi:hypothetical protein
MAGPIATIPISEMQKFVGFCIETYKSGWDAAELLKWMSIAEYLKDARRWHYAEGHSLPDLHGKALCEFVDAEIESNRIDV